jgi:hypothetical protein
VWSLGLNDIIETLKIVFGNCEMLEIDECNWKGHLFKVKKISE